MRLILNDPQVVADRLRTLGPFRRFGAFHDAQRGDRFVVLVDPERHRLQLEAPSQTVRVVFGVNDGRKPGAIRHLTTSINASSAPGRLLCPRGLLPLLAFVPWWTMAICAFV